jgi:hypothetical protein
MMIRHLLRNVLLDLLMYLIFVLLVRPEMRDSFLAIPIIVNIGMLCSSIIKDVRPGLPFHQTDITP